MNLRRFLFAAGAALALSAGSIWWLRGPTPFTPQTYFVYIGEIDGVPLYSEVTLTSRSQFKQLAPQGNSAHPFLLTPNEYAEVRRAQEAERARKAEEQAAERAQRLDMHKRQIVDDLKAGVAASLPRAEIAEAVDAAMERALPLGIQRVKYIKIFTLWILSPEAAPEPADLAAALAGPGDQDARMKAALALPPIYTKP